MTTTDPTRALVIFDRSGRADTRWYRSTPAATAAAHRILATDADIDAIDIHRYDRRAAEWLLVGRLDRPSADHTGRAT